MADDRGRDSASVVRLTLAELKANIDELPHLSGAATPVRVDFVKRVAAEYVRRAELAELRRPGAGVGTTAMIAAKTLVEHALVVDSDGSEVSYMLVRDVASAVWGATIGSEVASILDNWKSARVRVMIDIWRADNAMNWPKSHLRLEETGEESEDDPIGFYSKHKNDIDAAVGFFRTCALAGGDTWGQQLEARRAQQLEARRAQRRSPHTPCTTALSLYGPGQADS